MLLYLHFGQYFLQQSAKEKKVVNGTYHITFQYFDRFNQYPNIDLPELMGFLYVLQTVPGVLP